MTKLFISLFFLCGLTVFGQRTSMLLPNGSINTSSSETLYVHTNTSTLLCGETLLYKIYCLQPNSFKSNGISKVVYLQLLNQNKEVTLEQKLFLENGTASGDLFIPTSVKTGNYTLLVYTKWMLNKSESKYFTTTLSIINPFQTEMATSKNPTDSEISINTNTETVTPMENKSIFSLEVNQTRFSNRALVTLSIKSISNTIKKGNYSISVRKTDSLTFHSALTSAAFSKINPTGKSLPNSLPELRGEHITGRIVATKENTSVQNISIGLSLPGKNFEFKIVKTNEEGKFLFHLDKKYTSSDMVVQVIKSNREDYTITIDKPLTLDLKTVQNLPPLNLNQNLKNQIIKRSIANQIQNAYYHKKTDSIPKTDNEELFYGNSAKHYVLDDYMRFPTLKEVITEIVKEMYFTKKGRNYSIGLKDYKTERKLSEPSLVLVDGLLIQDINELFEWNMNDVSKFSIIPGGYYYGGNLFDGVVSIITKKYDFETKSKGSYIARTNITIPVPKKVFSQEDYTHFLEKERIPDYRYQLIWLPEIPLDKALNIVNFFTSDINGTFEIVVEGFTEDGIPVSLKEHIKVE